MTFNELVSSRRLQRNLSQDALAKATGLCRGSIALYESTSQQPGLFTAIRIAKFLAFSLDDVTPPKFIPEIENARLKKFRKNARKDRKIKTLKKKLEELESE